MSGDEATACDRCGAFGDIPHGWVEGDCVLRHRNHSRKLVAGTFVCVPCVERHREWLTEIVELYAALAEVVLAGSVDDQRGDEYQKPRKAPASPSPLRLAAWALLTGEVNDHTVDLQIDPDGSRYYVEHAAYLGANLPDVPAVMAGWAQAAYDEQEWTATAPHTVSGAVAALSAAAEIMAGIPDVGSYDEELRWVRRSLRSAHGVADPKPLGACLNVECRGKVWPGAGAQPKCDRCARRYGTHDLVRLKLNEASA